MRYGLQGTETFAIAILLLDVRGNAREEEIKARQSEIVDEPHEVLYMHDDNAAAISVIRTGRNPTMRTLGRVHGVSISAMHERLYGDDFKLGYIPTWGYVRRHPHEGVPRTSCRGVGSRTAERRSVLARRAQGALG